MDVGAPGTDDERALYRIQTVAEMTGVAAPTLRAWERRYGIPTPSRTDAAYRLYSARDVAMIRHLRSLCEGGLRPAEAARMVHDQRRHAVAPLRPERPRRAGAAADPHGAAVRAIVDAVRSFAPADVEAAVRRSTLLGTAREVFDEVYAPAMRRLGELWHAGQISIAQEHLASGVVEAIVRELLRMTRPESPIARAVLACFANEDHALGLLGFALAAQERGVRVVELGPRTPPGAVADAVDALAPSFVGLSITIPASGAAGRKLVDAYAASCRTTRWLVGGAGAASVAGAVRARGGVVVGDGGTDVSHALDAVLGAALGSAARVRR